MKMLRIYSTSINDRFVDEAVEELRRGGIIIYPTDTFYALGCSALNNGAIERLCKFKNIDPRRTTPSVVCADISQASEYAHIDNAAFSLLRSHTPGPYTFLLPSSTRLPKVFKGRKVVGIRIPDNAIAQRVAEELGNPILSTSLVAESGRADEVASMMETFDISALMIDGGDAATDGSTVVDLTDSSVPEIVRQGIGKL